MIEQREKLIELLDIIIQPGQKTLGDIADHILADGWTRLPCKVGDILYVNYENITYPVTVDAIRLDNKINNQRICVKGTSPMKGYYYHRYRATFKFNSIGKSVFLSREAAEKALKGVE